MAVAYVVFGLIILLTNLNAIPNAVYQIVYGAFHPEAVAGGIVGVCFKVAVQKGVARGIFSPTRLAWALRLSPLPRLKPTSLSARAWSQ